MSDVWLPNHGKKCFDEGWQGIGYRGVDPVGHEGDLGLRLDHWIVVDCDCDEALYAWLAHIDRDLEHTWVRRTPNGWHLFYKRTVDAYTVKPGKYPEIHLKIDVKAGMGHQVAYRVGADERPRHDFKGCNRADAIPFDPAWLPERSQAEWLGEEWSEMPDGIGDNSMIAFAGTFRRWGMDHDTILRCLAAINTVTMTENPMPPKRIRRLAKQAAKWDPEDPKTVLCPGCEKEIEYR